MSPTGKANETTKLSPKSFGASHPTQNKIIELLHDRELDILQIVNKLRLSREEIEGHLATLQRQHRIHTRQDKVHNTSEHRKLYRTTAVGVIRGKSATERLLHPVASQILNLLTHKEMSLSWIAKELDIPKSKVNYHIVKLLEEELIIKTRTEQYPTGLIKPFYRAKWKVNLPRLEDLKQEGRRNKTVISVPGISYLESLKSFVWGWMLGNGYSSEDILKILGLPEDEEKSWSLEAESKFLMKIASVLETIASEEPVFLFNGLPIASELKFRLLDKAIRQIIDTKDVKKDP